jgi:hypothetical protein
VAAALVVALAASVRAEDKELPESNLALLNRSLELVAGDLLNRAALPSGTRLAIATEGQRPVDQDMEHALLTALTQLGIEAWTLTTAQPEPEPAAPPAATDSSDAPANPFQSVIDSIDATSAASAGGGGSQAQADWLAGVSDHLPVLVFEVEEARIDYPRMYRSGIFGGQHVERRAMARVSARILKAETRAVQWVGVADTSLSDVVPRSDLKLLEDRTRAETRGTVPTSDWTKIAEPALVAVLVVGLVALFYSNRP